MCQLLVFKKNTILYSDASLLLLYSNVSLLLTAPAENPSLLLENYPGCNIDIWVILRLE